MSQICFDNNNNNNNNNDNNDNNNGVVSNILKTLLFPIILDILTLVCQYWMFSYLSLSNKSYSIVTVDSTI